MENLEKIKPRILQFNVRVNEDELARWNKIVKDRNWKMAAFIRVSVEKEIARLEKEGK